MPIQGWVRAPGESWGAGSPLHRVPSAFGSTGNQHRDPARIRAAAGTGQQTGSAVSPAHHGCEAMYRVRMLSTNGVTCSLPAQY